MPLRLILTCVCGVFLLFNCVAQDMKRDTAEAHLCRRVGEQFLEQADYKAGNEMLRKALVLYEKHKQWLDYFEVQNSIAKGLWRGGQPNESLEMSRGILQKSNELIGEGTIVAVEAYNNMGAAYGMKGFNDISLNYFDKSLRLRRKLMGDDDPALAKAYHNIGVTYNREGHYDEALEYLNKALEMKIKNYGFDDKNLISSYQVLGMVYLEKKAYTQARDYFQKALKLIIDNFGEQHPQTADGYSRLAASYQRDELSEQAFVYYRKAQAVAQNIYEPNHPYWIPIYNNIGEAFLETAQSDSALFYFEQAKACALENYGAQHRQTLHIVANMGLCCDQQQQHRRAIRYFEEAASGFVSLYGGKASDLASIYNDISEQYLKINKLDSALWYAHRSLFANVIDFEDSVVTRNPDLEKASYYSATDAIRSLLNKGKISHQQYLATQKIDLLRQADAAFALALQVVSREEHNLALKTDKTHWLAAEQATYQWAARTSEELYRQTGDAQYLENTFNIAEKNKSVLLSEALHESDVLQFGGIPDSIIRKERDLSISVANFEKKLLDAQTEGDEEKINHYENRLFASRQEQRRLQQFLQSNFNKYYQANYQSKIATVPQLQQTVLAANQALIEYFLRDSVVYMFVLYPNDFKLHIADFPQLKTAVGALRRNLARLPTDEIQSNAQRAELVASLRLLHQKLIEPLRIPAHIERLIIVPDDVLNYVPFDVLLASEPQPEKPYSEWDYLLRHYAISYSYTATLLHDFAQRPVQPFNQKMLALAPHYPIERTPNPRRSLQVQQLRSALNELPGAQNEVKRLENLFDGTFLYKEQANERNFHQNIGSYGFVHLAMHGQLNRYHPTESALVLSENSDTLHDNMLYAHEINNFPLKADLVVLSACETGYGKFQHGEGSMSLARSFMYAGVHSVIMSMWEVNDQSTQSIMYYFYQQLIDGYEKDVALQRAKLQYLSEAKGLAGHPFLWGAFVPLGETKSVSIKSRTPYGLFLIFGFTVMVLMLAWNKYLQIKRKR